MSYCPSHGHYTDYLSDGCPDCHREESDREAIRDTLFEIAYRRPPSTNLGDYECPSCRQQSLRSGADVCPLCQRDIPPGFWLRIWEREKAARERAAAEAQAKAQRDAAEWERTRPEREAAEKAAALRAEKAAADIKERARIRGIAGIVVGAVVGYFVGFIAAMILVLPIAIVAGLFGSNNGFAVAETSGRVVIVLLALAGAWIGWNLGSEGKA